MLNKSKMENIAFSGWVYNVILQAGEPLPFLFVDEETAIIFCKDQYPNTIFQIVPVPVFKMVKKHGDVSQV